MQAEKYKRIQDLAAQCLVGFPGASQQTRDYWKGLADPSPGPKRRKELKQVARELDVTIEQSN
jgi:hypothetical protein